MLMFCRKKIYFDGFLPPSKLDVRLKRLQGSTKQLSAFHETHSEPCRTSFPSPEQNPPPLFRGASLRTGLTALPPLPFIVPAILEALAASTTYGNSTEVVPGEADLYCAKYLLEYGGIVFTSDSDLLVHDLGPRGAVSFFNDIEMTVEDTLRTSVFQAAALSDRLKLLEPNGTQSLAFEIFLDSHGTFPKLLKQAQSGKAVGNKPKMFEEFLQEYTYVPGPSLMVDAPNVQVLQKLDPRISEYALQFPSVACSAGRPLVSVESASISPRIFLPFLLDCPSRTNAWEASTAIRQLAYGLVNIVVPSNEQVSTVFEYRKQLDKSTGRKLETVVLHELDTVCTSISEMYLALKAKFPRCEQSQVWIAVAVQHDVSWANTNSRVPICQLFLQNMARLQALESPKHFNWDITLFFTQLHGCLYSLRILKQILGLVVSYESKCTISEPTKRLSQLLCSLPRITEYPDLGVASSIIRKDGDAKFLVHLDQILVALDYQPPTAGQSLTANKVGKKKKRKRDQQASELPVSKTKSNNMFAALGMN